MGNDGSVTALLGYRIYVDNMEEGMVSYADGGTERKREGGRERGRERGRGGKEEEGRGEDGGREGGREGGRKREGGRWEGGREGGREGWRREGGKGGGREGVREEGAWLGILVPIVELTAWEHSAILAWMEESSKVVQVSAGCAGLHVFLTRMKSDCCWPN